MDLSTFWFLAIAFLFVGYFVLEGFDFGVGVLMRTFARDDAERRQLLGTIGPVWDGNEVWLITGAGAMFAAFPHWYASVFSGFYLPMLFILLALIVRGVAFEFRGKREDAAWRARWDWAILCGSLLPALLWGLIFANIVRGVPLAADHDYTGGLVDLLNPFALLGAATFGAVFVWHGAVFVALKTTGEVRDRSNRLASRFGPVAVALLLGFLAWLVVDLSRDAVTIGLGGAAALAAVAALATNRVRREGWAFAGTAAAIGLTVVALFAALHPAVLPSTGDPAGTLTIANAAASPYSLKVMTWVAVLFLPLVLLYQGWTYWVFRKRLAPVTR
ncbi:cytochrome c oxidase assembly protein [Asanoa ishikariensis]|uniref:Cytochrome bd-I ubiquinol oxidase subunit 2 apoprotein n=1 Tax=Asanoa ishikariensis TaxID=137265 RepID=A0A1H3LN96_9ACTN|nr:cytochrome d ubiquinol oxidase subunit II [Asanoa ishikariensis]GIF65568.1 cytochrome c oxidase assembly protein [Asanoa ishikariensis]SDY65454.1 cytochrome bd-I ubiquinol oxidase subunit 2 apoprotein [Asanoa ishikariensis]